MISKKDMKIIQKYPKLFIKNNAKIFSLLREYPRNLSEIARQLKMPTETVRSRVLKLVNSGLIKITAIVDYYKLGLGNYKAFVKPKAIKGINFKDFFTIAPYTYLKTKVLGQLSGFYFGYNFPLDKERILYDFYEEARRAGLLKDYSIFKVTTPLYVFPDFSKYFDTKRRRWNIDWDAWVDAVLTTEKVEFPELSVVSKKATFDEIDLTAIAMLQENGMVRFASIARNAGITLQGLRYHYYEHIEDKKLILGYHVDFYPYPPILCNEYVLWISFTSEKNMFRFVGASVDKPFMKMFERIIGENELLTTAVLPVFDQTKFFRSLEKLVDLEIISFYKVGMLDKESLYEVSTVPPGKYYRSGAWTVYESRIMNKIKRVS